MMKNNLKQILWPAVFASALFLCISCGEPENLVQNSGFETGEGDAPEAWAQIAAADAKIPGIGIDNSQFHSGAKSYKIPKVFGVRAGLKTDLPVPIDPEKKYLISFWYKTEGNKEYPAAVMAQFKVACENNPSVTYSKGAFNSEEWVQCHVILDNIPADAKDLSIEFNSRFTTKGNLWIDDVEFKEAGKKDIEMFETWRRQEIPSPVGKASNNKFEATGFFRVEKGADRWWFVDPKGNPSWALATVASAPNPNSPNAQTEWFKKTYGTTSEEVTKATYNILSNDCGFNWYAGWTGREFANVSAERYEAGQSYMPMTQVMGLSAAGDNTDFYAQDRDGKILNTSGHQVVDPFNPEWRKVAREKATRLIEDVKGKPWFCAWYVDNEMDFGYLYRFVWAKYSSQELIKDLEAKYKIIDKLNQAWTSSFGEYNFKSFKDILVAKPEPKDWDDPLWIDFTAFERRMLGEYINYTYDLIKELDPDHLVISNRINLGPMPNIYRTVDLWGKYDIVCMNIYPNNIKIGFEPGELEIMRKLHEGTGKPIIIGEWSIPAIDSKLYEFGVDSIGRPLDWSWPQVLRTQKERGEAYDIIIKQLTSLDFMIGSGWFKTTDVNQSDRRANRGLMNGNYELYTDLTDAMKKANNELKQQMGLTF